MNYSKTKFFFRFFCSVTKKINVRYDIRIKIKIYLNYKHFLKKHLNFKFEHN